MSRPVTGVSPACPAECQTPRITSNADAKQWTVERIDVRIDAEPGGSAPLGPAGYRPGGRRARERDPPGRAPPDEEDSDEHDRPGSLGAAQGPSRTLGAGADVVSSARAGGG